MQISSVIPYSTPSFLVLSLSITFFLLVSLSLSHSDASHIVWAGKGVVVWMGWIAQLNCSSCWHGGGGSWRSFCLSPHSALVVKVLCWEWGLHKQHWFSFMSTTDRAVFPLWRCDAIASLRSYTVYQPAHLCYTFSLPASFGWQLAIYAVRQYIWQCLMYLSLVPSQK